MKCCIMQSGLEKSDPLQNCGDIEENAKDTWVNKMITIFWNITEYIAVAQIYWWLSDWVRDKSSRHAFALPALI